MACSGSPHSPVAPERSTDIRREAMKTLLTLLVGALVFLIAATTIEAAGPGRVLQQLPYILFEACPQSC